MLIILYSASIMQVQSGEHGNICSPQTNKRGRPAQTDAHRLRRIYLRTGIDESMIKRLINAFYARIRTDQVLGPIFAARI